MYCVAAWNWCTCEFNCY